MPWFLLLIGIPGLISIPFYFFDLYLKRKIEPVKSFKKLLLYLIIMLPVAFAYVTLTMTIIIKVMQLKH